jgi:hypothetical protein
MCKHRVEAKAAVIAGRNLSIALLTVGMGVNSTLAGSDHPPVVKFTPVAFDVTFQPGTAAGLPHQSFPILRYAGGMTPSIGDPTPSSPPDADPNNGSASDQGLNIDPSRGQGQNAGKTDPDLTPPPQPLDPDSQPEQQTPERQTNVDRIGKPT